MSESQIKDIAIVTAYIQSSDLIYGSFFNTIDDAYKIACEFVEHHKNNLPIWNPDKAGLEFDEAIEKFVNEKI